MIYSLQLYFFGIYYTGEKYDEYHPRQSGPQEEIPK